MKIVGATGEEGELEMAALTTDGANVMVGTKMKNGELNISRTESPAASKVTHKKFLTVTPYFLVYLNGLKGTFTNLKSFDMWCPLPFY